MGDVKSALVERAASRESPEAKEAMRMLECVRPNHDEPFSLEVYANSAPMCLTMSLWDAYLGVVGQDIPDGMQAIMTRCMLAGHVDMDSSIRIFREYQRVTSSVPHFDFDEALGDNLGEPLKDYDDNPPRSAPSPHWMIRQDTCRFSCQYPGCPKSYQSSDAVRKHCRKCHPDWLHTRDLVGLKPWIG